MISRLEDIMETEVVTSARAETVLGLVEKMSHYRIGAVVVVDPERRPVGIVTERDVISALALHQGETLSKTAGEIMSSPLVTQPPDATIESASDLMKARRIRRLAVVDGGKLVGVVTYRDLFNALGKHNALLVAETEALMERANRDPLTGLYNKQYIAEQLAYHIALARRYNSPMALMMIDVDHFKKINDTRGHLCGDRVLQELAELLRQKSRAVNIAGRYGGDEFVVIGPISYYKSSWYLAERLRTVVEEHLFCGEEDRIRATVSIGVAVWEREIEEPGQLIKIADDALYRAKREGRNRVVMGEWKGLEESGS